MIGVKIYLSQIDKLPINIGSLLFLLLLIVIFYFENKISLSLGILTFVFCIYHFFISLISKSSFVIIEFTTPLKYLILKNEQNILITKIIPLYFYIIFFIVFSYKLLKEKYLPVLTKTLNYSLILLFTSLILIRVYVRITQQAPFGINAVLFLFILITIFWYKNKFTWTLGIILWGYGIYHYFFIEIFAAEPTIMQFTNPLNKLLDGSLWLQLIHIIPFSLYILGFVFFPTKYFRKIYNV